MERNQSFLSELSTFRESIHSFEDFRAIKLRFPSGIDRRPPKTQKEILKIMTHPVIKLKYSNYKNKGWHTRENERFRNITIGNPYDEHIYHPIVLEFEHRAFIFDKHLKRWREFCDRWLIKKDWDGTLDTLRANLRNPAEIYFCQDSNASFKEKGKWLFFLRINEWTSLNDLKTKWKYVELIKKHILGKMEMRPNIARDLCWYDLKHTYNLSPKKIADIWRNKNPRNIDILALKRIQSCKNSGLKMENTLELLEEIRSDPSLAELKEELNEEREAYLGGKYPLLIDIIKKAIKRMEKLISQICPQESEEDLIFIQRVSEVSPDGKPGLYFNRY